MMSKACPHVNEWDPRDPLVLQDQITAYDAMRQKCPVAHSEYLHWSVFSHAEAMRVLNRHEAFSNKVSERVSVPNGMDPPQHTPFRRIIEPYFGPSAMAAFEPACRQLAQALAQELPAGEPDIMAQLAHPYALQIQCAFMGWPGSLHQPLQEWMRKNHAATLSGNRKQIQAVAKEFDGYMLALINERRLAGAAAPDDVTTRLTRERIDGQLLGDEALISILRNWTVGELGTIAASVGIIAHYLASNPAIQTQLRRQPGLLSAAIAEILRIHAPLIANRRITTQVVQPGGRKLAKAERVSLLWASVNRDETVFGDPDVFRLDRDPSLNLLYGAGVHICPGAPLARLELQLITEALLGRTRQLSPVPGKPPVKAIYPGSGFTSLILQVS